jgi:hypothetical protein
MGEHPASRAANPARRMRGARLLRSEKYPFNPASVAIFPSFMNAARLAVEFNP